MLCQAINHCKPNCTYACHSFFCRHYVWQSATLQKISAHTNSWPQSSKKKILEFSRLLHSHKLIFSIDYQTKSNCNNDLERTVSSLSRVQAEPQPQTYFRAFYCNLKTTFGDTMLFATIFHEVTQNSDNSRSFQVQSSLSIPSFWSPVPPPWEIEKYKLASVEDKQVVKPSELCSSLLSPNCCNLIIIIRF